MVYRDVSLAVFFGGLCFGGPRRRSCNRRRDAFALFPLAYFLLSADDYLHCREQLNANFFSVGATLAVENDSGFLLGWGVCAALKELSQPSQGEGRD